MCVVINFSKLVSFEPDSFVSKVTFACPVLCQPAHSTTRLNLVYDFHQNRHAPMRTDDVLPICLQYPHGAINVRPSFIQTTVKVM